VSIAIPFYNAESTLLDAVRSVYAQTHTDWELLLIDDGSTDQSLRLASKIDDPRVRVFSDGVNVGLAARLNQVTELAKFDYIARMDADDLMSEFRIEKQLKILIERPNIDLVSTGVCSIDSNDRPLAIRGNNYMGMLNFFRASLGRHGIVHASVVGRKDWFSRNPYNVGFPLAEDYELWLRASKGDDLVIECIDDPLYFYREEGNVSPVKLSRAYSSQIKVLSEYPLVSIFGARFSFIIKKYFLVFLSRAGFYRLILSSRGRAVNGKEFLSVESSIEAIKDICVPGVPGVPNEK
jgi:glycosyltransferase involved in cell wall biosynthesis